MSWFSTTFSLSPEQGDDDGGDSPPPGGKGEFSELTKNLTRQLWGVASFLAPPPTSQEGSPKHTNTPQTDDPQAAIEEKSVTVVGGEAEGGSPSASGDKLTGFRSDLAELRGTMATGFSRIQTVIRAVTQDEEDDDVEEDDAAETSLGGENEGDETAKKNGLGSLLKPLLVSMSSFRERIPKGERGQEAAEGGEGDTDDDIASKPGGQSKLAGLSRLATSFIPYARDIVGEISGRNYYAVALTDEVVAFADNIAMHPETWLDFPVLEEEDDDDFEMTEAQQEHAKAVDDLSSSLAAVHSELCPAFISEGRFWKIYFVLLHSRLSKEDAELLSTSQIMKTRELLLGIRKDVPGTTDTAPTPSEREELGLTESNMAHLPYEHAEEHLKSSAESLPSPIKEEVPLDDASHSKSESSQETPDVEEEAHDSNPVHFAALKLDDEEADADAWLDEEDEDNDVKENTNKEAAVSMDEDVSFSDLEDDEDECSKEDAVRDVKSGSKPEHDWHTVNKEDVTSPTSSSS